jgi:hypothetical protein
MLKKLWVIVGLPNSNLRRYMRCAPGFNVDLGRAKALATDSSSPSGKGKHHSQDNHKMESATDRDCRKVKASFVKIRWLHLQLAEKKLLRLLP